MTDLTEQARAVAGGDDGIRECHGVTCTNKRSENVVVNIWEGELFILIGPMMDERRLTPDQARYLAAKLYRLSRRLRGRLAVRAELERGR